jgi:hypothetical protein
MRLPIQNRFWPKVQKTDGCWLWLGAKHNGYGQIGEGGRKGRVLMAHRVSWELHNGPIRPETLCVLHKCDNPSCVRPDHLFLGTQLDNIVDRHTKKRSAGPPGEDNGQAKLSEEDVIEIRRKFIHLSSVALAREYGVSKTQILRIVKHKSWSKLSC